MNVLVAEALKELGVPVSVSHEILPEFREYERGATVVVNAYLAPKMSGYLTALQAGLACEVSGGFAGGDAVFGRDRSGAFGSERAGADGALWDRRAG